jgi:methyl-accepting chemotaxis protein
MTVSRKILGAATIVLVAFAGTAWWLIQCYTDSLYEEKRLQIERLASAAASLIDSEVQSARTGERTVAEAQAAALAAVAAMRYGEDGYFWVNDTAGIMVMHPVLKEWAGQDKSGLEDANGVQYIKELTRQARAAGQGSLAYEFRKPGSEAAQPKFSHVKLIPQWGWIVGTGIYVDDVKTQAAGVVMILAVVVLGVIILSAVLFWIVTRAISQGVREVAHAAERVALGDIAQTIRFESNDEVGALASAARAQIAYIRDAADAARALGAGNLAVAVQPKSDGDVLSHSFNETRAALERVIDEIRTLIGAASSGRLDVRGDTTRHSGVFADVVQGLNTLLDSVVRPLKDAAAVLDQLGKQDLTGRMSEEYQGEFARIRTSLHGALESLTQTMTEVAASSDEVAQASREIANGSQMLAGSATEQAAMVEEVSASLHELTTMTRRNAESTRETRTMAQDARAVTGEGMREVERLSVAMKKVHDASADTAKIVRTIDEIAFQTNLLALNAAVEAARAGDAGRGFAVVAEEVRALSLRSAEAAKNTAELIEQAVQSTEVGVTATASVLERLRSINDYTERVTTVIDEIAGASEQQAHGVEQIANALQQMDSGTQSTAANAEESASMGEELAAHAWTLRSLVERFRLDDAPVRTGNSEPAKQQARWEEPEGNGKRSRVAQSGTRR